MDDDLPILTEVLRVGPSRRPVFPAPQPRPATDEPSLLPSQVVVGHDVQARLEPYVAPSTFDVPRDEVPGEELFSPIASEAERPPLAIAPFLAHPTGPSAQAEAGAPPQAPVDLDALGAAIRESVLHDLASRIDTELDARIAQALHVEVESAVARLAETLRDQLAHALRDVVRRAVDQEIAQRRGEPE